VDFIGTSFPKLESWLRSFSIELLADVLKPVWIEDALLDHQRQSVRVRKLPSALWCVVRGSWALPDALHPNVLARLGTILGWARYGSMQPRQPRRRSPKPDRVGFVRPIAL